MSRFIYIVVKIQEICGVPSERIITASLSRDVCVKYINELGYNKDIQYSIYEVPILVRD
jgi:hypothetical protein